MILCFPNQAILANLGMYCSRWANLRNGFSPTAVGLSLCSIWRPRTPNSPALQSEWKRIVPMDSSQKNPKELFALLGLNHKPICLQVWGEGWLSLNNLAIPAPVTVTRERKDLIGSLPTHHYGYHKKKGVQVKKKKR